MSDEKKLFELLKEFSIFAGMLSRPHYGNIEASFKSETTFGKFNETVVTVIDHSLQELLLAELLRKGFTDLAFNGEEDTHLKFFFSNDYTRNTTLHCDPIDGTASFQKGNNRYCTGYGLSHYSKGFHDFFSTVIYSPLEKKQYWAFEDSVSKHVRQKEASRTACYIRCFNSAGKAKLQELGYQFAHPGSAHLAIVDIVLGRLGSYLWWNTNPHDALIPFAFAKNYGVYPTDEHGKKIKKFKLEIKDGQFQRIPKICWFANDEIRDELIPIISSRKYTI